MKKIITFFIMYLFICAIKSQQKQINIYKHSIDNNIIVIQGNSWSVVHYNPYTNENVSTEYIFLKDDSVFNEITYYKVYSSYDKLREEIQFTGLIREESGKVYFVPMNLEKEYLTYDFTLEQGMLYEGYYESVFGYNLGPLEVNIDSIEIDGSLKKRI